MNKGMISFKNGTFCQIFSIYLLIVSIITLIYMDFILKDNLIFLNDNNVLLCMHTTYFILAYLFCYWSCFNTLVIANDNVNRGAVILLN